VLQQPLGDQHHQDALAAALGVPDDTALAPADAFACRQHTGELMRPRHLLAAGVEDDEVPDEIEQAALLAQLGQGPVQQRAGQWRRARGGPRLPLHEMLLFCRDGAVAQPLRVVAGEQELDAAEEVLVENLLLVGDQLAHAVGDLDRAALEFDHRDGDAVEVEHDIRPPLMPATQRHLLGEGEVVAVGVGPVNQMHRLVRTAGRQRHRARRSGATGRCAGWPDTA